MWYVANRKTKGGEAIETPPRRPSVKDIETDLDAAIKEVCHRLPCTSRNSFTSITFHALPAPSQLSRDPNAAHREAYGAAAPAEVEAKGKNENGKSTAIEKVVCH